MAILLYQIDGKEVNFARLDQRKVTRFLAQELQMPVIFDPPSDEAIKAFASKHWVDRVVNVRSELGAALTKRNLTELLDWEPSSRAALAEHKTEGK